MADEGVGGDDGPADRPWARTGFVVTAGVFLAMLVVQVLLAGLGIFESGRWWSLHKSFGYSVVHLAAIVTVVFAYLADPGRRVLYLAVGTLILLFVMPGLATATSIGFLAAFHPVAAFVLFGLAVVLTERAWTHRREARVGVERG